MMGIGGLAAEAKIEVKRTIMNLNKDGAFLGPLFFGEFDLLGLLQAFRDLDSQSVMVMAAFNISLTNHNEPMQIIPNVSAIV